MYEYKAKVLKVLDGDTVDCMVDLGFNVWMKQRVRLSEIDAPEVRTKDLNEKELGIKAKDRVVELLYNNNNEFILISNSIDKYGRCLGTLVLNDGKRVKDILLEENLVDIYE
jgi:micrococcal nuclease